MRRIRLLYARMRKRTARCRFCSEHTQRDMLTAGVCEDCKRDTLEWIAEVPGWQLTREVGT